MTASITSIRKRLLEVLPRRELEVLSNWEDASRRGRDTVIKRILDNWNVNCDIAIQKIVDTAKIKE